MSTEKKKNKEFCINCGAKTFYTAEDPVKFRYGYVEGAGQLCFKCSQIHKMHKQGAYENSEWSKY